jgi:hypothetical protein
VGFKLGDFGLATLKSGHWRVQEGDSRCVPTVASALHAICAMQIQPGRCLIHWGFIGHWSDGLAGSMPGATNAFSRLLVPLLASGTIADRPVCVYMCVRAAGTCRWSC